MCDLSKESFMDQAPRCVGDILYEHLQLLLQQDPIPPVSTTQEIGISGGQEITLTTRISPSPSIYDPVQQQTQPFFPSSIGQDAYARIHAFSSSASQSPMEFFPVRIGSNAFCSADTNEAGKLIRDFCDEKAPWGIRGGNGMSSVSL